jgi:hypothetical protein
MYNSFGACRRRDFLAFQPCLEQPEIPMAPYSSSELDVENLADFGSRGAVTGGPAYAAVIYRSKGNRLWSSPGTWTYTSTAADAPADSGPDADIVTTGFADD